MPYKKNTLLVIVIIVLVSINFSHKLYGYIELSLNKLASFSKSTEIADKKIQTKSNINNHQTKNSKEIFQSVKVSNNLNHLPYNEKQNKEEKCQIVLPDITIETQKHILDDGETSYRKIKKYYEINTNLGKGYEAFLAELTLKLNGTFQHIERQLSIKLTKKIQLNFIFQTSREDYESYLRELGHSPEGSQGIYLGYRNLSIIEFKSYQQAIKTAIHEAIHTFNSAYWGGSFRFFNEGMAEYFESINSNGTVPPFNFSSLQHQHYPMQTSTLLFSETNWHSNNNYELYQNSKALFHFLMNNKKGRKVILKIMKLEMEDRCTVLPQNTIENVLIELFPNHEQEFNYWFTDGANALLNNE